MSYVWEHSQAREGDLLTLLALADFATEEGDAWPTLDRLARKARLSERQVQRALMRLEKAGELTIERGSGRGHESRYRVTQWHLLKGDKMTPFSPKRVTSTAEKGDIGDISLDLPYTRQETRQGNQAAAVTTNGAHPASLPPPPACPELADITESEKSWLRLLKAIPDYPLRISRDLPLLRKLVEQHGQVAVARGLDEYRDSPRRIRPCDPNQVKRFVAQAARWQIVDANRATPATEQRANARAYSNVFE